MRDLVRASDAMAMGQPHMATFYRQDDLSDDSPDPQQYSDAGLEPAWVLPVFWIVVFAIIVTVYNVMN